MDVLPQYLRKARVSWSAISGATKYIIESRELGLNKPWKRYCFDDNADENTIIDSCINKAVNGTFYDIKLDQLPGAGLGQELRIKAEKPSDAYSDSDYSSIVRIVDNPILRADGATVKTATSGTAKIEWNRISGVTRYTIKIRRMAGDHKGSHGWRTNNRIKMPNAQTVVNDNSNSASSARLKHTISNLVLKDIYAIQLNYEHSGKKVFSVRDVFVWPSKPHSEEGKLPIGEDERVATYPYFAHWPNKEYRYRICETSFPSEHRIKWVNLINHALEQWETATDGLITVTRDTSTTCSFVDRAIGLLLRQYPVLSGALHINDVYMVDDATLLDCNVVCQYRRQVYFSNLLGDVQAVCVFNAPACTISKAYGEDAQASTSLSNASGSTDGVDILFRKSEFEDKSIEIPDSTTFNKCLRRNAGTYIEDERRYFPYRTALHEAGHALGTSGAVLWEAFLEDAQYRRAHPSIPDTVMNYDEKIPENYNPNFVNLEGEKVGKWLRHEPDCSPHPFDILAIYALYQHVEDSSDE